MQVGAATEHVTGNSPSLAASQLNTRKIRTAAAIIKLNSGHDAWHNSQITYTCFKMSSKTNILKSS